MDTLDSKIVEEALRKHQGKIVRVVTHLQTHLSPPQVMLCIGQVSDGSRYLFVDSVRERLDGSMVINGVVGRRNHVGYDDRDCGSFYIYNNHEQYPFREQRELSEEDHQKAMKLWKARTG